MATLKLIRGGIAQLSPSTVDAVLTTDEQAELERVAKEKKEAGVVAFLTPFLKRLCLPPVGDDKGCPLVMLNSEKLPWLINPAVASHRNLHTQPDLFTSWAPFVEYRDGDVAGVLGAYALQHAGCVRQLFEAKLGPLTDSCFGELHSYMSYIPGICRGMLFNSRDFWLYEANGGHPVRLIKGAWRCGGAANAIQTFFQSSLPDDPPLVSFTRVLLKRLNVRPHHEGGRCFLGSGATGYVFRVRDDGGNIRALKVMPNASHALVTHEFAALQSSARAGASVVPVVDGSLHLLPATGGVSGGGGFLLQDVGEAFQLASPQHCDEAFEALAALHRLCITHGDPRLPNLLRVNSDVRWIDMREASPLVQGEPLALLVCADVFVLARSVLGLELDANAAIPPSVEVARSRYVAAHMNSDATRALAAAVWAARSNAQVAR